jgi:hypothetical protein
MGNQLTRTGLAPTLSEFLPVCYRVLMEYWDAQEHLVQDVNGRVLVVKADDHNVDDLSAGVVLFRARSTINGGRTTAGGPILCQRPHLEVPVRLQTITPPRHSCGWHTCWRRLMFR